MKKQHQVLLLSLVVVAAVIYAVFTRAPESAEQSSEASPTEQVTRDVYKDGDIIKIVVPMAAGGGIDLAARLFQPYFEGEIEKITGADVSVIVENITGAGGLTGNVHVYKAAPDGKTLGFMGLAAAPYLQLISGGQIDLEKYIYIGQVNTDPVAVVLTAKSEIDSFEELINRSHEMPMLVGSSGRGGSDHMDPLMMQLILKENGVDLNMDFVMYTGTSEVVLAIQRGEAEGMFVTESSVYNQVQNGDIKGIALVASERGKYIPDAPTVLEQNVPGAQKMIDTIGMNRIMIAPPGLPQEIASVLEEALMSALANSELLEKAVAANIRIEPADAATTTETARQHLAIAIENQAVVEEAIK